jgi:predicted O-methyltransferase YrrM
MEIIKKNFKNEFAEFAKQKNTNHRLWNISENTAELLYSLVLMKNPKQILEIGTSNGYSTFWLSLAAESCNSLVTSIEVDTSRFNLAKENLKNRNNIKLINQKAENAIPNLTNKYDFVFIDAGKINYIDYIKLLQIKLNNSAVIIADNATSHSHTVEEYLSYVKSSPNFSSMTLPIDAGLEITIYNETGDNNA